VKLCTDGDDHRACFKDDYFGGPTSTNTPDGDWEHDGLSNYREYLSGCDPTAPDSVLDLVESTSNPDGSFTIRWSSQSNRYYRLLRSQHLLTGFTPILTALPATPPENTFTDTNAPPMRRAYYRVEVE
jgi:hypothetical protein